MKKLRRGIACAIAVLSYGIAAPVPAADISFAPALGSALYRPNEFFFGRDWESSDGWGGMWMFHRFTHDLGLRGATPPPSPALKIASPGSPELLVTQGLYRASLETP